MSDLLKVIRSESFIESSGYSWAKVITTSEATAEKVGSDSFLMATSNQSDGRGESFREKEPKKSKKKKFVVTVNMSSSSSVYSKGRLLEAGKFVENIQHEIYINNALANIRSRNDSDHTADLSLAVDPQSESCFTGHMVENHKEPFKDIDDTFLLTAPPSGALPEKLNIADTLKSSSKLLSSRNPDKIKKAGSSRFRIVRLLKEKPVDTNPIRSEADVVESNMLRLATADSGTLPLKKSLIVMSKGMSLDVGGGVVVNPITVSEIMGNRDGREMTWSRARSPSNDSKGSATSKSPKSPSRTPPGNNPHIVGGHKVPNLPLPVSVTLSTKEKAKLTVIQEASMHSYGSGSSHPITPHVVAKAASPQRLKSHNQLEDILITPQDNTFDRNNFPDSKHYYSDMSSSHSKSNNIIKPHSHNDRQHCNNSHFEKLLSPDGHKAVSTPTKRSLRPISADSKRMPLLLHVVDMADFRTKTKNSIV